MKTGLGLYGNTRPHGGGEGFPLRSLHNNQCLGAQLGHSRQLDRAGTWLKPEINDEAHPLLLSGEPIEEPIAGRGHFVMNSRAEIGQGIDDFRRGKLGRLPT